MVQLNLGVLITGWKGGFPLNRELLFSITVIRDRKNIFPVIREITNLLLQIREHGL